MDAPTTSLTFSFLRRTSLLMAIQTCLAVALAFYLGGLSSRLFTLGEPLISGLWCVISAILVLQTLLTETIHAAWFRLLGSLIGCLTSGVIASFFGYHFFSLILCILVTVILVSVLKIKKTFRLACLTAAVVIIIGMMQSNLPAWQNSLSRFIQSILGAGIATLFVAIFLPLRKKLGLLKND